MMLRRLLAGSCAGGLAEAACLRAHFRLAARAHAEDDSTGRRSTEAGGADGSARDASAEANPETSTRRALDVMGDEAGPVPPQSGQTQRESHTLGDTFAVRRKRLLRHVQQANPSWTGSLLGENALQEEQERQAKVQQEHRERIVADAKEKNEARTQWLRRLHEGGSSPDYSILGSVGQQPRRGAEQESPSKSGVETSPLDISRRILQQRSSEVVSINADRDYHADLLGYGTRPVTYSPEDLNPYARSRQKKENREESIKRVNTAGAIESEQQPIPFTNAQVRAEVDFKKVAMLIKFTGKQGMILGRRKKQIKAVTQRKVARAIKTARQMALMPRVGMHPGIEDEETAMMRELFEHLQDKAVRAGM